MYFLFGLPCGAGSDGNRRCREGRSSQRGGEELRRLPAGHPFAVRHGDHQPTPMGLRLFTLPADKKDGFLISPDAYRLNNKVTYLGTSTSTLWIPTYQSLLYPSSLGGKPMQWQGASYKLNNGLRINTYGEYDANGYKRTNPSAMPWQRRNFNAAFEVKSPDGKFGIKLEVSAGRY